MHHRRSVDGPQDSAVAATEEEEGEENEGCLAEVIITPNEENSE